MTPLAHRIVKELTLPVKGRTFEDRCHLLKQMSDVHCFDVTEVIEQAEDLGRELSESGRLHTVGDLAFLPAPKTWIEWDTLSDQGRVGVLLQVTNDNIATGCWASDGPWHGFFSLSTLTLLPLQGSSKAIGNVVTARGAHTISTAQQQEKAESQSRNQIYGLLALINTPRIVGRVTRNPHKGLERALLARRESVGHWPLHAWHEIKLSITPPDAQPGEIEEGHLTGKKALHFVRQHLRIRLGKLELVSAHWRGDAQLGIKRARYAVTH